MTSPIEYISAGFALVQIPYATKGPTHQGWNERDNVITTVEGVAKITGNVGLAHAYCTPRPTAALDIDDYNLASNWFSARAVALHALVAAEDSVLIDSGRENRTKLLFSLPDDVRPLPTIQVLDPKTKRVIFEFRCASKNGKTVQDVLPPSVHPDTGKQYKWGGNGRFSNPPFIPIQLLNLWKDLLSGERIAENKLEGEKYFSEPVPPPLTLATLTQAQIRDLRSALLHLLADDRKLWVDCGMALHSLGDVGRGLWMEWSATSIKFDAADAARVWASLQPSNISYRSIFTKAQAAGWLNPAKNLPPDETPVFEEIEQWPVPQKLPTALKAVPELDPELLPDHFQLGVVDIADRLQCKLDFVAVPLLVGAGSLIGNKVGIHPKANDETWTVYPALWGAIVGPPGSMKTPAQTEVFKTLYHLEEQASIQHQAEMVTFAQAMIQHDKDLKAFTSGKSTSFPTKPDTPKRKRYLASDITYQALGVVLSENPNGILAFSDELSGLLQSLDSAGQEAARGFYLSGWGGSGHYSIDRIGRGSILLINYCISIFGGFQPDRLKLYVRQTQAGSSNNDGLIQRFQLIVWPDQQNDIRIVDRLPNKLALDVMSNAFLALNSCQPDQRLHFEGKAQELFNKWYIDNEELLRNGKLDPARHSHFAKFRSLIPGLALLHHMIDGHSGGVCFSCLEKSIKFAGYLKEHAERIYASVQGLDNAPMLALAAKLRVGALQDGFTLRDLNHKGWSDLSDKGRAQGALDGLVVRGWLAESAHKEVGRPTVKYLINPRIGVASSAVLEAPP